MNYQTILYQEVGKLARVTLNRPDRQNALNGQMIAELHHALTRAEQSPESHVVVLEGAGGVFCAGMDFDEAVDTRADSKADVERAVAPFFQLLRRFTLSPRIIAAQVDGAVTAGGVGLVVASDFAVAAPGANFGLSETLFGLLPAMVVPFLVRRVGFQPAYLLVLTAQRIDARKAEAIGLIDEVSDDPQDVLRRLLIRVGRIAPPTIATVKRYFSKMSRIDDDVERAAIEQISDLMWDPSVSAKIRGFVRGGDLPWQK